MYAIFQQVISIPTIFYIQRNNIYKKKNDIGFYSNLLKISEKNKVAMVAT